MLVGPACLFDASTEAQPELSLLALRFDRPFSVVSPGLGGNPTSLSLNSHSVYLAGESDPGGANRNWRIERRDRYTGELVGEFGIGGALELDPGAGGNDELGEIAADESYIYISGVDRSAGSAQWHVEKRSAFSGQAIAEFGSGGALTIDPVPGQDDFLYALFLDGDSIYLAGSESTGGANQRWRIERRSRQSGALDGGFGTGGVVTQDAGNGTQTKAWALETNGGELFVAGAYRAATVDWRTEKRDASAGGLVGGFGVGGQVNGSPTGNRDEIYDLAVGPDSVYVGGLVWLPTVHYRVDRYARSDGSPVAAFGVGGALDNDYSALVDNFGDLCLDGDSLYLAGGEGGNGADRRLRIDRLSAASGAPIESFGQSGALYFDFSAQDDDPYALKVLGDYLYIAGVDRGGDPADWRLLKVHKLSGATE